MPIFVRGNGDGPSIPANFVARSITIAELVDLEGLAIDPAGEIVVVVRGVCFAPGGKRLPAKRNGDLLGPATFVRRKPFLRHPLTVRIESEFPRAVEIQPVQPMHETALSIRPGIFRTRQKGIRG